MDISVSIIARDEKAILPKCLASAHKLSTDIVIVSNSSHEFVNYSDQKNYAISLCKNDLILSLDDDEELTPALIEEIKTLDYKFAAYSIPRKNIIFQKTINHTNWDPDGVVRLFNRNTSRFIGAVHEQLQVDGKVGKLKNPIIHHNYSTVEDFISRMNSYTSLETQADNPVYDFLRRYIWHAGFLDGLHGLFLSYLMVIYHLATKVKLWEKPQRS